MKYNLNFELSFTENTYPGKYYAFEGIDGSGKTTQVHKLAEYFRQQGKEVVITKEPTDNIIGQLIKKILHKEITVPSTSLQYLFAADRGLHLETDVIPSLKQNKIVISDRSFWSAVAYGIADLSLNESDKERLLVAYNILTMYNGYIVPDKTFVIDVPADIAIDRVEKRHEDITLYEFTEKLKKVREEYTWMAERFGDKVHLINGTQSVETVFQQIVSSI